MIVSLKNTKANQGLTLQDALDVSITTVTSEIPGAQRQFAKHYRLLIQRQQKQRIALQSEEQHEYDDLMKMQNAEMSSIAAFEDHRAQYENGKQRKLYYNSLWNTWRTEERLIELEKNEKKLRYKIVLQEHRMRATFARLQEMDGRPLLSKHTVKMLIFSEKVRRAAFYRQELEEAMALNIPGFDPEIVSVEGISDRKLDWMKNVACPFTFADDCPFFPTRVRESLPCCKKKPTFCAASPPLKRLTICISQADAEKSYTAKPRDGELAEISTLSLCASNSLEEERSGEGSFPKKIRSLWDAGIEGKALPAYAETTSRWTDKMPGLSRANRIALKSALNQGHYRKSKCSFLPLL